MKLTSDLPVKRNKFNHEKPMNIGINIIQIADASRVVPISSSPWIKNSFIVLPIIPPAPDSIGTHDTYICILERQHVDNKTNKKAINLIEADWTLDLESSLMSIRLRP